LRTLRAAFLNQSASQLDEIVAVVAERAWHSSDDFAVRNLAGALLGVMMATLLSLQPTIQMPTYLAWQIRLWLISRWPCRSKSGSPSSPGLSNVVE